jgi:hypothetical protein
MSECEKESSTMRKPWPIRAAATWEEETDLKGQHYRFASEEGSRIGF